MWKDTPQNLGPRELLALELLSTFDGEKERKAFCFRYLFGDKEAAGLAQLFLHDNIKANGELV